jgi:hypothetical protein
MSEKKIEFFFGVCPSEKTSSTSLFVQKTTSQYDIALLFLQFTSNANSLVCSPPLPLPPLGLLVLLFLLELTNGGSLKVSLQATREGRSKDLGGVRERNIHGKEKSTWWGGRGLEKQRGKPKEREGKAKGRLD